MIHEVVWLHGLALLAEAAGAGVVIGAGLIGARRWRTASGWLLVAGGLAAIFGLIAGFLWPHLREALGHPFSPGSERTSRIMAIANLFRAGGWAIASAGALLGVRVLVGLLEERATLAGIRSEEDDR